MCQIIFSPEGKLCSEADFWSANNDNPDGIGVMSQFGVQKFFGKRQCARAWAYVGGLAKQGYAWAAHFRWGTAGLRSRDNVHPFRASNGVLWMHNGVFNSKVLYDKKRSDTAMFVDTLGGIDNPDACVDLLEIAVGAGNKLLAYAPELKTWTIINEHMGDWDDGIWYSNEYSRASWGHQSVLSYYRSKYGNEYEGDRASTTATCDIGTSRYAAAAIDGNGKQIVVVDDTVNVSSKALNGGLYTAEQYAKRAAANMLPLPERMALMQSTRSDSALPERLADCVTCASMELKRCLCTPTRATSRDLDLGDVVLDALDTRTVQEDSGSDIDALDYPERVSLSDPALIQERVDAYLAAEADERAADAAGGMC